MAGDPLSPAGGWNTPAPARLRAPPVAERGPVFRLLSLGARWFGRADVPDVIAMLHINRGLLWRWLWFAARLMPFGRLPAAAREKIILRVAWNTRSRYEWGQHVQIALASGVDDAAILRVTRGPDAAIDDTERLLLRACDEWFADKCLSDVTWVELAARYDAPLRLEMMLLIGHYEMIAGVLNTAGLVLEPPIEAELQAFHRRIAALPAR